MRPCASHRFAPAARPWQVPAFSRGAGRGRRAQKNPEMLACVSGFIVCDGGMNEMNNHVGRNPDESLVILDDETGFWRGGDELMKQFSAGGGARRHECLTSLLAGHIMNNAAAPARRAGRVGG